MDIPYPRAGQVIVQKVWEGGNLSDEEIMWGIKFFEEMADYLVLCGPVFRLAFQEANRIHIRLLDYQTERNKLRK